jgi:hypothetical protein
VHQPEITIIGSSGCHSTGWSSENLTSITEYRFEHPASGATRQASSEPANPKPIQSLQLGVDHIESLAHRARFRGERRKLPFQ